MAQKKNTTAATGTREEVISDILKVTTGQFECCIVGTSPIIHNRMSQKAWHELLLPKGRKNAVEKATTLKHNPVEEYRASPYILPDGPTVVGVKAAAFKKAMCSAAIDMPGAKKAQIGRLVWVESEFVPIYGLPQLLMSVVRSADMNRTPDIRSRAIFKTWACRLVVTFTQPLIRAQAIANLLADAGLTIGVGDWRQEKGSGSYGQFRIADKDDPEFKQILKVGRAAQLDAFEHPTCYDAESAEMLDWFDSERKTRSLKGVA
jgi:hypothetical protein